MYETDYTEEEMEKLEKNENVVLVAEEVRTKDGEKRWRCECDELVSADSKSQRAKECPQCERMNVDEKARSRSDEYEEEDDVEQSSFMDW